MIPWELGEKELYEWVLAKIAKDELFEQKEQFAKEHPSQELAHIYKILDEKVIPMLHSEGIPITLEEAKESFANWYVKRLSPETKRTSDSPEDDNRTDILRI